MSAELKKLPQYLKNTICQANSMVEALIVDQGGFSAAEKIPVSEVALGRHSAEGPPHWKGNIVEIVRGLYKENDIHVSFQNISGHLPGFCIKFKNLVIIGINLKVQGNWGRVNLAKELSHASIIQGSSNTLPKVYSCIVDLLKLENNSSPDFFSDLSNYIENASPEEREDLLGYVAAMELLIPSRYYDSLDHKIKNGGSISIIANEIEVPAQVLNSKLGVWRSIFMKAFANE